ncbi:hypothetical protein HMN09_00264000 [Mycena chlorophos]|uniref:Ketoreductase domain-containing protein n=1 Tax=Mycena chlorophos TaxID=658473 RepID=A0A8H6THZ1_MYCCL|nr:hypothetical protein HMN09_00264000 [Mycena chlorophos]
MADNKVVLVTGGNTGLGYEIVKALYASSQPYTLLIGARTPSKGESAIAQLKSEVPTSHSSLSVIQVDVSSDTSIEAALATISSTHGRLDALINNAGALFDTQVEAGSAASLRAAFNANWDTNVSGTHVLTTLAVPLLLKSADPRVLFITSGTASLGETEEANWGRHPSLPRLNAPPPAGWPKEGFRSSVGYRSSKTGLNMLMREWARILKNDGVKVWAISPGFLATNLGGVGADLLKKMGALEPSTGGQFIRAVVEGQHDKLVGQVIRPGPHTVVMW